MKGLIALVVLGAALFFGYPLLNEDAAGECDALERAAVRIGIRPQEQLFGQLLQGLSKGQFAAVAVRNEYPNLPVTIACTMLYWRAILDPERFRGRAEGLR